MTFANIILGTLGAHAHAHAHVLDNSISETHLTVKVTKSKTDQYRKGNEVVISRSGKVSCPVLNLERYMALAGIVSFNK